MFVTGFFNRQHANTLRTIPERRLHTKKQYWLWNVLEASISLWRGSINVLIQIQITRAQRVLERYLHRWTVETLHLDKKQYSNLQKHKYRWEEAAKRHWKSINVVYSEFLVFTPSVKRTRGEYHRLESLWSSSRTIKISVPLAKLGLHPNGSMVVFDLIVWENI